MRCSFNNILMTTMRAVSIIIFGAIAALGLYLFVFRAKPAPTQPAPSETTPPVASPTPAVSESPNSPPQSSTTNQNHMHQITLQTSMGDITFDTYDADAPKAVNNFLDLAHKGFYKNVIFHRVIKDFMIQGGDPTGTGRGGPGYQFEDELNPTTESYKVGYAKGVVAMANAGPNTNGSQFFILLKDTPLPHSYTIFGRVVAGQDVVDGIGNTRTDGNDRPLDNVVIKGVIINSK